VFSNITSSRQSPNMSPYRGGLLPPGMLLKASVAPVKPPLGAPG
jgi:hypothetical protein